MPLNEPSSRWTHRPSAKVLVCAWAVVAAQTPDAAAAFALCLALALLAHGWRRSAPAPLTAAAALREIASPAPHPPARRRTDASRTPGEPRTTAPATAAVPTLAPTLTSTHPPSLATHHLAEGGAAARPPVTARDPITGLPTHQHLHTLGPAWWQPWRVLGLSVCVLRVGLEGVETLATQYGRDAAHEARRQVAARLQRLARADDLIVQLDGGDIVLLLTCPPADCQALLQRMRERITHVLPRPIAYRTLSKLQVAHHLGSAIWPQHGDTLDLALEHATQALADVRRRDGVGLVPPCLIA